MYAASVRPDVAFVVKELARRLAGPTTADWGRARRLLRYLRGTLGFTLKLTGHEVQGAKGDLNTFADANWAAGASRRSTSV
eukprot:8670917-Heterocapsa_arctica.AAC.1